MSGLSDEAVLEGHDLIDGAEHEAQADPKDFKKVHPVGETGGSILSDSKGKTGTATATASSSSKPSAAGSKIEELKERLNLKSK